MLLAAVLYGTSGSNGFLEQAFTACTRDSDEDFDSDAHDHVDVSLETVSVQCNPQSSSLLPEQELEISTQKPHNVPVDPALDNKNDDENNCSPKTAELLSIRQKFQQQSKKLEEALKEINVLKLRGKIKEHHSNEIQKLHVLEKSVSPSPSKIKSVTGPVNGQTPITIPTKALDSVKQKDTSSDKKIITSSSKRSLTPKTRNSISTPASLTIRAPSRDVIATLSAQLNEAQHKLKRYEADRKSMEKKLRLHEAQMQEQNRKATPSQQMEQSLKNMECTASILKSNLETSRREVTSLKREIKSKDANVKRLEGKLKYYGDESHAVRRAELESVLLLKNEELRAAKSDIKTLRNELVRIHPSLGKNSASTESFHSMNARLPSADLASVRFAKFDGDFISVSDGDLSITENRGYTDIHQSPLFDNR